jgi:hypothetical protein
MAFPEQKSMNQRCVQKRTDAVPANACFAALSRIVAALVLLFTLHDGHAQLRWTPVNPTPTENAFFSVAYGVGTFVAVGDFGVVATSSDGAHWVFRESGTAVALESVIYANNQFMAAAVDGTVLTSPDGIDWASHSTGATFSVNNLAYGNGTYVMAGDSEIFMTSADGQAWIPHTLPYTCYFNQTVNDGPDDGTIVFASGRFVAAYENCVLSSADGINWTLLPFSGSGSWSLDYIKGDFVAFAGLLAEISSDGINWTAQPTSANTYPLKAVCNNSTSCIGLGLQTLTQNIAQSDDGSVWKSQSIAYSINGNAQNPSFPPVFKALAFGNGLYVAVGASGIISYSADGIDWMSGVFDLPDVLRAVAFGKNIYVAVGDRGTIQTSSDGQHWSQIEAQSTENLNAITYGNSTFVAAGTHGAILTSSDGTTWTPSTSVTSSNLMAVVYGSSGFVAVGSLGTVLTSTDAMTWNAHASGVASTLRAVAFGSGRYVAAGDLGNVLESSTGTSWTQVAHGDITTSLYSLAYGNGQFVALGQPYPIFSTDGITWNNAAVGFVGPTPILALTFGGGMFMTANQSFTSLSSTDVGGCCAGGLQSTSLTIRAVAYGTPGYAAVGNSGVHMFSSDGSTWITTESGSPNVQSRLSGIAAGGGAVMAVGTDFASTQGGSPADLALISNDNGASWKPLPTGYWNNTLTGVAYHNGAFVASGSSGDAVVYDGLGWTTYSIGIGTYLSGISYTNDRYFVLGNSGHFATSFDGATWQPQSQSTYSVKGVAYGLGAYVLVGSDIYASTDATNWNHVYSAGGYEFNTVAFGRNTFVAAGDAGVAISHDGSNWTLVCQPFNTISSLIFDGTKFVGVGSVDAYVSFDGVEWRRGLMHTMGPVHGITSVSGGYIAASEFGGIKRSADDLIFSNRFDGVACPL